MSRLRVAFVGMKRPPSDLPDGYWPMFVQFHLELPYYYARYANCAVDLITVEPVEMSHDFTFLGGGAFRCVSEHDFRTEPPGYDVVIHWRRWFDDLYVPGARNVILCQDHSFSEQWKSEVGDAYGKGKLEGILVFPTWHKENTRRELAGIGIIQDHLYEGLTLGVDTSVYRPGEKDPFHLLWASDPGRGLGQLIPVFLSLWGRDRRFRLTVTYPDYVRPESLTTYASFLKHPAVRHEPSVRNGPKLWSLFNDSGILPYTSTFPEPSSRCHRQAMAAGSLVLYPPNMGTPSRLLEDGLTGFVRPIEQWADSIANAVCTEKWHEVGSNARSVAVRENWVIQAARFHHFFSKGIE